MPSPDGSGARPRRVRCCAACATGWMPPRIRGGRRRRSGWRGRVGPASHAAWLLREPDRVELAVQEVAGGDGPAVHLGVVGDDAVPLEGHDVVDLLVVEPLLEGAQDLL